MAFLDDAGLVKLWQHIQARLSNKVDKAPGKVLSSNDFTDEEKNSLATISSDYLTSADKEELLAKLEENGGGGAFFEPDDGDLEGTTPTIDADTLGGLPPSSFVLADELEDKYIGANLEDVVFGESYITGVESILKPQLPLNLGEQFIAPITYYDQIILPDGSRWDGVSSGGGGNVDIDISHLATRDYVDDKIANINIDTTNLATYDYVDEEIAKIAVKYFTNEDIDEITGGCPLPDYKTYTLRIDESNSNPLTTCEYMDDAAGMEKGSSAWDSMPIFDGIKPCVFKDGEVVYYLNPDNFALKEDGSAAKLDGTDGDVMIEFQKFAYRIYREGDDLYVSITNNPELVASDNRFQYYAFSRDTIGDVDKMYIGAFKGYVDADGKMRSVVNGELPTTDISLNDSVAAAGLKGENYSIFEYGQLVALQCLYLIKYGSLDSQTALGMGFVENYDEDMPCPMGRTIDKGMYYGSTIDGTQQMKFVGIEDLWGNVVEWVEGFESDETTSNYLIKYGNQSMIVPSGLKDGYGYGYVSKVLGNTEGGFSGTEFNGDETTYYADGSQFSSSGVLGFGAHWGYGAFGGLFCLRAGYSADAAYSYFGTRLTYI